LQKPEARRKPPELLFSACSIALRFAIFLFGNYQDHFVDKLWQQKWKTGKARPHQQTQFCWLFETRFRFFMTLSKLVLIVFF